MFRTPPPPSQKNYKITNCQVLRNQELMYQNFIMYMLANHDQNIQSRFRLLKVCLCVELESSVLQDLMCKSAKLDQSKIRLDRSKLVQIVFLQNFPTQAQAHMTCKVLYFASSIKRKTLATFYCCCLYCVYKSLVRSRGICLHTYLRLSRIKIHVKSLIIVLVTA